MCKSTANSLLIRRHRYVGCPLLFLQFPQLLQLRCFDASLPRTSSPSPLSHPILPSDIPPCPGVSRRDHRGHSPLLPTPSLPSVSHAVTETPATPCCQLPLTNPFITPPKSSSPSNNPLSKHPSKLAFMQPSRIRSTLPTLLPTYPYCTYPCHTYQPTIPPPLPLPASPCFLSLLSSLLLQSSSLLLHATPPFQKTKNFCPSGLPLSASSLGWHHGDYGDIGVPEPGSA